MVALPAPTPVTKPAAETVAIVLSFVVHVVVDEPVIFFWVPSS